jgi:hypothetical protein
MEESAILEFRALAKAIDAAWLRTRDSSFTQKVDEFRQVEREFVQRAGDDENFVLETKRGIAEAILRQANVTNQPFHVCRDAWNELVQLGFSNIETTVAMSWFYGDSCLRNAEAVAGFAVIEPLAAEFERLLADPEVTEEYAEYYRYELDRLSKLRLALKAQLK